MTDEGEANDYGGNYTPPSDVPCAADAKDLYSSAAFPAVPSEVPSPAQQAAKPRFLDRLVQPPSIQMSYGHFAMDVRKR